MSATNYGFGDIHYKMGNSHTFPCKGIAFLSGHVPDILLHCQSGFRQYQKSSLRTANGQAEQDEVRCMSKSPTYPPTDP